MKSEFCFPFTLFENEKWNENALRSRSRMKSEMKVLRDRDREVKFPKKSREFSRNETLAGYWYLCNLNVEASWATLAGPPEIFFPVSDFFQVYFSPCVFQMLTKVDWLHGLRFFLSVPVTFAKCIIHPLNAIQIFIMCVFQILVKFTQLKGIICHFYFWLTHGSLL